MRLSNLLFLFLLIIASSCNNPDKPEIEQDPDPEFTPVIGCDSYPEAPYLQKMTYVKHTKFGNLDTSYVHEYIIDNNGRVVNEKYKSYAFAYASYESVFLYDDNGRISTELRNGELYQYVNWTSNKAQLFDAQDKKLADYYLSDNSIVGYRLFAVYTENQDQTYALRYDSDCNLIELMDETVTGTSLEYLDHDDTIKNPFFNINSLSILRFWLLPFSEYIHKKEKQNPYQLDDVVVSQRFYDIVYELDDDGKVSRKEHSKPGIYYEDFHYE